MTLTPSITEDQMLVALRTALLAMIDDPDIEVVQGQANRVPEPIGDNFITFTPINRTRLSTNVDVWDQTAPAPTNLTHTVSTAVDVQLDLHGPLSADLAQGIKTLWRDDYTCQAVDPAIFQPLYASDGHQMPFVNGEAQYEQRWTMMLTFQSNPAISTSQQFADTVAVTIEPPVDAEVF